MTVPALGAHGFDTAAPAVSAMTTSSVSSSLRLWIWEFLQVGRASVHVVREPPVRGPGGVRGQGVRRPPAGHLGRRRVRHAWSVLRVAPGRATLALTALSGCRRALASCCTSSSAAPCPSTGPACPLCGSGCSMAGSASPSSCLEVGVRPAPCRAGNAGLWGGGGGEAFPEMPGDCLLRLPSGP